MKARFRLTKPLLISLGVFLGVGVIIYFQSKEYENDFKLGYPFTFYEQFQLKGNKILDFGSDPKAAIYDYLIILVMTYVCAIIMNLIWKSKIGQSKIHGRTY